MECPVFVHDNRSLPVFHRVEMNTPHKGVADIETEVNLALDRVLDSRVIRPGHRVAVAVGSRNIAGLPVMVRSLCRRLRAMDAVPVIIPAMGSHGGAMAEGQVKVLESLGVTEEACGAAVRSSMDVEIIDSILDGVPVCFSKDALSMDHSVAVNRIKPHTKFKGPVESGIYKMLCIGMGKHKGAAALHQAALRHGFYPVIKAAGDCLICRTNIRFALGVVENGHDEPVAIEAMAAQDFFEVEQRLLNLAKSLFPRLPFKTLDALIIRNIGKDISGSGMDPNVTGRAYDLMEDDFSQNLRVTRIALLDLSAPSGGNAIGLGNADIITEKLYRKMDYEKTLVNALTSTSLRKAFIPIRLESDKSAVQAAFFTLGLTEPSRIRAVIIRDTRHVTEFWVSSALLPELENVPEASVGEPMELVFDGNGDLLLD